MGSLSADVFIATAGNAREYKNGRQYAAWMGLTPRPLFKWQPVNVLPCLFPLLLFGSPLQESPQKILQAIPGTSAAM